HGVAVRARCRIRAVPDLRQRAVALRTAPGGHRSRLPSDVRRPHAGSKDATAMSALRRGGVKSISTRHGATISRTPRPFAVLVLVAVLALVGRVGAPMAPPGPGTATHAGTASHAGAASHAGTGESEKLTARDNAVTFAECMRRNGVSDFPDPNGNGAFVYEGN